MVEADKSDSPRDVQRLPRVKTRQIDNWAAMPTVWNTTGILQRVAKCSYSLRIYWDNSKPQPRFILRITISYNYTSSVYRILKIAQ